MCRLLSLALLFFVSTLYATNEDINSVTHQARVFYHWYIKESAGAKDLLTSQKLKDFVTFDTYQLLMTAQKNGEMYVDYFIKVQDFDDSDWLANITVYQVVFDPVCTNVYMSFGTGTEKQQIVNCFVKEKGIWKIKFVTNIQPAE